MVRRTGPSNPYLKQLVENLKKKSFESKTPMWKAISERLGKPARQMVEVNLSKIERYANNGDTVIVPGVVLSSGQLTKAVTVAAWRFSATAEKRIKEAKGKCLTIEELVKENPKGSNVKIIS